MGSGVSDDLGIPKWTDLIKRIDEQLRYNSEGAPESYRAEQLFQHYKAKKTAKLRWQNTERLYATVASGWRDVVAQCLYTNFRNKDGNLDQKAYEEKIAAHPYLRSLGKLARRAQLVVTHNFDDALELAIDLDPASVEVQPGRRYYSFWRPEPFLRRGMVNIYHPNGFTPLRGGTRASESLILTEASFADHLANTNAEESHFLLRHLSDKTCLIVGHSLSDGTLKNALRQHASQRPAHVNYYVHWHPSGEAGLNDSNRNAIREANFETYNLITIFASSKEIADIVQMISMNEDELRGHLALQSAMVSRFVYYIVGAVSSGKSTIIRHLRNLETIEEWPNNMPTVMNRPSIGLNEDQEQEIDRRLEEAIWVKNSEIGNIKNGIVAVDRAPLDFVAFPAQETETLGETARKRTTPVLKRLEAREFRELCPGQVIVVQAEPDVLLERQLQRGRIKPEEVADGSQTRYLERQQDRLGKIYQKAIDEGSVVKTNRYSVAGPAKTAARIIHLNEYKPFDFSGRLEEIKEAE